MFGFQKQQGITKYLQGVIANLAWLWLCLPALAQNQFGMGLNKGVPQNEEFRIQESIKYGDLINKYLKDPSEENSTLLAEALRKDSKLIPAIIIVKNALERFPDSEEVFGNNPGTTLPELYTLLDEQISKLKNNYDSYLSQYRQMGNPSTVLSMVSIKYHLGYVRDSFRILDNAIKRSASKNNLEAMKHSFFFEKQINSIAFLKVENEFHRVLAQGEIQNAMQLCSQLFYLGIYAEEPIEELVELQERFPQSVNSDAITVLISVPEILKSNQYGP